MLHCATSYLLLLFTQHNTLAIFQQQQTLACVVRPRSSVQSRHLTRWYLSLLGNDACRESQLMSPRNSTTDKTLTLNVSNALLEDLVEDLGVLELLLDLGNDALGKLLLLALLDLALVADPGVKDGLGLGGEGSLLLHLVSLGLELGGLLFRMLAKPSLFPLPACRQLQELRSQE